MLTFECVNLRTPTGVLRIWGGVGEPAIFSRAPTFDTPLWKHHDACPATCLHRPRFDVGTVKGEATPPPPPPPPLWFATHNIKSTLVLRNPDLENVPPSSSCEFTRPSPAGYDFALGHVREIDGHVRGGYVRGHAGSR